MEILARAWHRRKGGVDDNPNSDGFSQNEKLSSRVLVFPPAKPPLTFVWFDPINRGLQKYERFAQKICFPTHPPGDLSLEEVCSHPP
jgi:hypothetical protein